MISRERMTIRPTSNGMQQMLLYASALVLLVGLPLVLAPDQTAIYAAWTIDPPITAAFLGAAYWASFLLVFLSSLQATWARTRIAVPAVLTFSALTLLATLLHLDRFHLGTEYGLVTQIGTWVWLGVYVGVPPILSLLLVLQRRTPGKDPARVDRLPRWLRLVMDGQAAVLITLGIAFFILPKPTTELIWPWALTPLTGRMVGAWLLGLGVAQAHMVRENDWWRIQSGLISATAFALLELLVLARFQWLQLTGASAGAIDWADPRPWLYGAFLASILAVGVYGWVAARRAKRPYLARAWAPAG